MLNVPCPETRSLTSLERLGTVDHSVWLAQLQDNPAQVCLPVTQPVFGKPIEPILFVGVKKIRSE